MTGVTGFSRSDRLATASSVASRASIEPRTALNASNTNGLHRVLTDYIAYYLRSRTHLALGKDTPVTRPAHRCRPDALSPSQKSAVYTTVTTASPHSCRTTSAPATAKSNHLCVEHFRVAVEALGRSRPRTLVCARSEE